MAAVLMGVTAANAQLIIGGNLGVGGTVGNKEVTDGKLTTKSVDQFNLTVAPKIGYQLMDGKMEVGAAIALGYNLVEGYGECTLYGTNANFDADDLIFKDDLKTPIKTGKRENLTLSVTPYVRYFFLQKGIFSLGIQGQVGLGGQFYVPATMYAYKGKFEKFNLMKGEYEWEDVELTKDEAKEINEENAKYIKDQKNQYFAYDIRIMPVMKFDLSEHCYMDITLNAIGLYAGGYVRTYMEQSTGEAFDTKVKESSFNGGFTGFSQGNAISVGFAYRF